MEITPATFAALLTASGAPIAAAVIQGIITFLKSVGLTLLTGREKLTAFALSILTVVTAVFVGINETPPRYSLENLPNDFVFLIALSLLAVYNIGRLSMAIYDDVSKPELRSSLRNPAGWTENDNTV